MRKGDQISGHDYEIQINGLEIYAFHGVFPEEKQLGQRFLIDLALQVRSVGNLGADSLDKVLSYAEITSEVHSIFTSKAYNLLETVANDILL
ncbi:MAG: dihydroneopterin aldolase, partial [Proteobacteria bacterium]|nr:dihydroneopterin aldolase [Pseudomonadota bacterium]